MNTHGTKKANLYIIILHINIEGSKQYATVYFDYDFRCMWIQKQNKNNYGISAFSFNYIKGRYFVVK